MLFHSLVEKNRKKFWSPGSKSRICSMHFQDSRFEYPTTDLGYDAKNNILHLLPPGNDYIQCIHLAAKVSWFPSNDLFLIYRNIYKASIDIIWKCFKPHVSPSIVWTIILKPFNKYFSNIFRVHFIWNLHINIEPPCYQSRQIVCLPPQLLHISSQSVRA